MSPTLILSLNGPQCVFFFVSASALSIFSLVYTSGSACCYFSIPHTVRERALHPGRDKGQGSL